MNQKEKEIIKILKKGGVGVMPTDTLYGLVGSAFSNEAIKRIYKIKKRDKKKPLIVLISSLNDLKKFNIKLTTVQSRTLNKVWPGKVSVVVNNIAFRLPAKKLLIDMIKKTGPLVAPSANPEGLKPAESIGEAEKYFSYDVDFYLAGGTLKGEPSTLIKLNNKGEIELLRGILKK